MGRDQEKLRFGKILIDQLPFHLMRKKEPVIATIFSPSGGVGKSSMAMNLGGYIAGAAFAQAEEYRQKRGLKPGEVRVPRVLVLDGDIVHGSLSLRLANRVTPSLYTLTNYLDTRGEAGFVGADCWPKGYASTDEEGGKVMRDFVLWPDDLQNFNLLAAPENADSFFYFRPVQYLELMKLLASFYDVIIIDSGTEIVMESQRAWLAHAHHVFLLTAPDIDRIYNAGRAYEYITKAKPHPRDMSAAPRVLPPLVDDAHVSVVLTRADFDSGLPVAKVMKRCFPNLDERRQLIRVPDVHREMAQANNTQRFLALENQEYGDLMAESARKVFDSYVSRADS